MILSNFGDMNAYSTGTPDEYDQPSSSIEARLRTALADGNRSLASELTLELLLSSSEESTPKRHRLKDSQIQYYPAGWRVQGLPAEWFRTLASAVLFSARNRLGLSQKDFASLVGTHASTLCRIEHSVQDPTLGTLLRVLDKAGFIVQVELHQKKI